MTSQVDLFSTLLGDFSEIFTVGKFLEMWTFRALRTGQRVETTSLSRYVFQTSFNYVDEADILILKL